jgi:hypothetical protein
MVSNIHKISKANKAPKISPYKSHTLQKFILLIFLCVCILIIGCSGFSGNVDDGKRDEDYNRGSGSLSISFNQNAPPARVFQNQRSDIILKLQNEGSTNIRSGVVMVSVDKSVIELRDGNTQYFDLRGKSTSFPQGEVKLIPFNAFALPLNVESQIRDTNIIVQSCYDYLTEVITDVCIDMDPYNIYPNSNKDVCQSRTVSPGATGGPVKVISIEPRYSIENDVVQPNFIITVSKVTERAQTIFATQKAHLFCSSSRFDPEDIDKIKMYVELSDVELACDRSEFTLYQNQAQIICSGFGQQTFTGTYTAPLYIRLDYGVSEAISKKISIVR